MGSRIRSFVQSHDALLFALACAAFVVLLAVIVVADPLSKSAPAPAAPPTTATTAPTKPPTSPRVQVSGATLARARGTSGRRRNRARLTISLTVTNSTGRPIFGPGTPAPTITVGASGSLARDPATATLAETLRTDQPLAPGHQRTGTLRFELAGGQTTAVAADGADLHLGTGSSGPGATVHVSTR